MKWLLTWVIAGWTLVVSAQWTTDVEVNTQVATGALSVVQTLGASDGSTYVVYWKEVGAPTNLELRFQRLDAAGVPQLGTDGVLVSEAISMSTYTVMGTAVLDAADNVYIGVTATDGELGHVFKLDAAGNHLWDAAGVTFESGYGIVLLPLTSGEAAVSWLNVPNAWVQKFDASGQPVWPAPQAVVSGTNKTAPAELFELSGGDLELMFHTYNFGISSNLWAQRYAADSGEPVWAAPVQLSNKATAWNTKYSVGQIGDATFIGYAAATGLRFDSFLQRVDPDGTLPWGVNGSDFDVNETDYEMNTRIAVGEGVVWSICNYKNPTQSENGERIQRFDSETGARQFTDNGKELFAIGTEQVHASDLRLLNGAPLFLMESGMDNGVSPTELQLVALDAEGDFLWETTSEPMATFSANKSDTQLTAPVNGQVVAVWREVKAGADAPYAQNVQFPTGPSSVATPELASGQLFPNPASFNATLRIEVQTPQFVYCEVVGIDGRLALVQHTALSAGQNEIPLDIRSLPDGLYLVRSRGKDGCPLTSHPLLVQH